MGNKLKRKHKHIHIHKYSPIGMDLGTTAIRAVQLRRRDNKLYIHSALELANGDSCDPNSSSQEQPIAVESQVSSKIKRLWESGGFVGRNVVIHCPAEKMDMRPVDLPVGDKKLPREAILGLLRLQVGGHLPFPAEHAVFDYLPGSKDSRSGKFQIMAITADGQWIKERIQWIESVGMRCIAVEALPCALSRLSTSCDELVETPQTIASAEPDCAESLDSNRLLNAVLDIGYSGSTLMVHDSRGPLFCRRFAMGGREITEIVAQRLSIDFTRAEQFKRRFGIDCNSRQLCLAGTIADTNEKPENHRIRREETIRRPSDSSTEQNLEIGKTIFAALQCELSDYVEGLTRSLNYVTTNCHGARLQKIYLAGAAAHTRNLDQYLADQFELPVQIIAHPVLAEIACNLPNTRAQTGNWTTALGLALKEMEEE